MKTMQHLLWQIVVILLIFSALSGTKGAPLNTFPVATFTPYVAPTLTPFSTFIPPPTIVPTNPPPTIVPTNPPPTIVPTIDPYQSPLHNSDWRPFFRTFIDVEMVLVPVGCFMMGSTSANDEQPVHRQCLDQPFWIDRTEVTNQTFGSTGTFTGANYPRDSVSWTDAYTHCQMRGARLPNEVEWEYAARGPDSLVYPWGNTMISSNLIYFPNYDINNRQYPVEGSSMPVGSYPLGTSWTGAVDMSGNLWEWVNSRYATAPTNGSVYAYPYDKNDGREQYSAASDTPWGLRGGSWGVDASRTTTHFRNFSYTVPQRNLYGIGFRCIRDYTPGDQNI